MLERTEEYMGIYSARIYPFLTPVATPKASEGYIHVVSVPGSLEGVISINAHIAALTVGQTLELIDALQRAVEIAQNVEIEVT
jgi:hypothetical protein